LQLVAVVLDSVAGISKGKNGMEGEILTTAFKGEDSRSKG